MRIAYIASGAAGMYCGTCLHDNALAAALLKLGHEVALVPTYTPLRTDEPGVGIERVFFGALNVYLQQVAAPFRRLPSGLGRLLDRPALLRRIARLGASTDPAELGALTLSVLSGEDGFQARELEKLAAWLRDDYRPEIVHLNNSLFVGFARRLKQELGVPVLCSVQGEDLFLGQLAEGYRGRVLATQRERSRDVDAFVANSRFYANAMAELLEVDRARFHVVPLGISLEGHGEGPAAARGEGGPFRVGYLARVCADKGLHVLVEAFRRLAEDLGPGRVRLAVAGYLAERDRPYLREIERRLAGWGLAGSFEYLGEVDRAGKIRFLQSLDVLSVPTTYREPKGLFALEALANGVPVVLPRHGAFPELIEATGGGVLVEPNAPGALAKALAALLLDPARRQELGRRGREAVHRRFGDRQAAQGMLAVYGRALAERAAHGAVA
jgi:glycosyltransferase involved in cell wall biosynthesis